jgi:hypothetical protein
MRWGSGSWLLAVVVAAGCTLPPNVIQANCQMRVTGVVPSQKGWVYCSTAAADNNLASFTVRDGDGNAIVVTAPGSGSFTCGKPNLEIELQFNGALQIAGCDPVTSCAQTSGSCTVDISQFSVGDKQAFSGSLTAFAAAAPMSSAGYNITLAGSFASNP